MKTCEYNGPAFVPVRSHPWTCTKDSPENRYCDFKVDPSGIRSSLEDFVGWGHYPAIEVVYTVLESLNGEHSLLESNDCAFSGPHPNEAREYSQTLQCSGRIMVLHRALGRNLVREQTAQLALALHLALSAVDRDFDLGVVGTTIVPVRYTTLRPSRGASLPPLGYQLMISFWAWGDSEGELMENLRRVVANLTLCLLPLAEVRRGS